MYVLSGGFDGRGVGCGGSVVRWGVGGEGGNGITVGLRWGVVGRCVGGVGAGRGNDITVRMRMPMMHGVHEYATV